jgi:LysM repeat protein
MEENPQATEPKEPTPLWLKIAVGVAIALVLYIIGITTWVIFGNKATTHPLPTRTPLPTFTPHPEPKVLVPSGSAPTATPSATPTPQHAATPAPTATQPSPEAKATQAPIKYTVQPGDTLSSISAKFGVSMEAIIAANGLKNPNAIYVGQVLTIPKPGSVRIHVVQPGETLLGIAAKYGVDYKELMKVNGITDPNTIYVGQKLVIP